MTKSLWTPLKEAFAIHAAMLGDWPGAATEAYKRARRDVVGAAVVDGRCVAVEPSHDNCKAHGKRLRRDPEVRSRIAALRDERPDLVSAHQKPHDRLTKLQDAYARHFVDCGVQRWAYQRARAEVSPEFRTPTPSQATESARALHQNTKVIARVADLAQAKRLEPEVPDSSGVQLNGTASPKRCNRGRSVSSVVVSRDVVEQPQQPLIEPETADLLLRALDAIRVVVQRLAAPASKLAPVQVLDGGESTSCTGSTTTGGKGSPRRRRMNSPALANDREQENSGGASKVATPSTNHSEIQCCAV